MKRVCLILVMALLVLNAFGIAAYAAALNPYGTNTVEGFLVAKGEGNVTIEMYNGDVRTFFFGQDYSLAIDTVPVSMEDFKVGMEVYATLEGLYINYMEGYSTENPGYISEASRVRTGTVTKIDSTQISVQLSTGISKIYDIAPGTIILQGGKATSVDTIYEGDRVKLFFDDIDNTVLNRIEVEGDTVKIKDIYRGELSAVDNMGGNITLGKLEVFENGDWQTLGTSKRMSYSTTTPIYMGGNKISSSNLKYYRGKTLYVAVKDFFGRDQIDRITIKNQYESVFSGMIEDVNRFSQSFNINNEKNLSFNDGTMIIKNGRLVSGESVATNADVFVVGESNSGSQMIADIVYIYNVDLSRENITQHALYYGKIYQASDDKITLDSAYKVTGNAWEYVGHGQEFSYDNDINVYDVDEQKTYTTGEVVPSYNRDENYDNHFAYIYTDGDRIADMVVMDTDDSDYDRMEDQRITTGTIQVVTDDSMVGWKIDLKNAADWSNRKYQWMPRNNMLTVMLQDAAIIKNGKIITPDELKTGDNLYMIRTGIEYNTKYGNQAKVVIVK